MIEVFWAIGTCVEVVLGKQSRSCVLNLTFLAILIMPKYGWRALLGVSAVPLVLFTLSCRWLPESPRFHMMSGNPDKALLVSSSSQQASSAFQTLESVCKTNGKKLPKGRLLTTGSVESRGSIGDLLGLQMRNTTLLLWLIWFACAFCYYGIVLMTTEILQELKEGTCDANDQCSFNCRDLDTVQIFK